MIITKKLVPTIILTVALSGCVSKGWNVSHLHDEFTNDNICRVERNSPEMREFARNWTRTFFSSYFFAEKYNDQVRAGIRSEPQIPIAGDVQIKIGSKLVTLTSDDTPIDVAPHIPQYKMSKEVEKTLGAGFNTSMKQMTDSIQKLGSPYRALTGQKAINLLRDMANTQGEIKYRTVGFNSALSTTGTITTGPEFVKALNECGIDIN